MKRALIVGVCAGILAAACTSLPKGTYSEPGDLARLIREKSEPYALVDVRSAEEYAAGHIPTAVNIPVTDIAGKPPTRDLAALIIVYCASGRRSAAAAKTLAELGYTRVTDFGGVSRWKGELVRGEAP